MVNSLPMMVSSRISTPSFFRFSISASMIMSGRRNSGMPYLRTPPATCSASKIVTLTPLRARSPAQARPDGPEPMMARACFCAPARCRRLVPAAAHGGIGDEPLQAADRDRLELGADHAGGLALRFLRADAAADGGQRVGRSSESGRSSLTSCVLQRGDEAGDIDAHRAARARSAASCSAGSDRPRAARRRDRARARLP